MKALVKLSIIAAASVILAFAGREVFTRRVSDAETSATEASADRLSDPCKSGQSFVKFNTLCFSGSSSESQTVSQVSAGRIPDFFRRSRKRAQIKCINGFSPYFKNGELNGVFPIGDSGIGDSHFPSRQYFADGFIPFLRKLRL